VQLSYHKDVNEGNAENANEDPGGHLHKGPGAYTDDGTEGYTHAVGGGYVYEATGGRLLTAARDPGDRAPAPGSLRLVQGLVNTLNMEADLDLLGSGWTATRWFETAGLLPAGSRLTGPEHAAVVELRQAVRQVLECHTGGGADAEAASRLTLALAPCRLAVTADPAGGVRLTEADHDPFQRAVGAFAVAIAEAGAAGTWPRLKSCPGHLCGWAFYDRSATGRSRWCSMQLCGARAKMRAYRGRQRGAV
jgi:predicted RNA-binding Zn ribbon-like protein